MKVVGKYILISAAFFIFSVANIRAQETSDNLGVNTNNEVAPMAAPAAPPTPMMAMPVAPIGSEMPPAPVVAPVMPMAAEAPPSPPPAPVAIAVAPPEPAFAPEPPKAPVKKKPKQKKKKIVTQTGYRGEYSDIENTIKTYFPNETVGIKRTGNKSLAVSGMVSDAEIAGRIMHIVEQHVRGHGSREEILNMMQIRNSQQVMLRVRVGEVQRTALKKYGAVGLASLEKDGLFKVLAEPNLTAISGETANFLSGGQIPVPMQSREGLAVNYKNYGVGLEFTPIVLSKNRIRLTVESEVSQLSEKGAVVTAGFSVPGISSRKAKTTVELAPGESFMIAGLMKDNINVESGGATPLSNIPILGSILRGSSIERDETELVISVTPYLVDPVKSQDIKMPTDEYRTPSNLENIFLGSLGAMSGRRGIQSQLPGGESAIEGTFGYMVD